MVFWLHHALPSKGKKALGAYVREYAKQCGWKASHVKYFKNRMEFRIAPDLGLTAPGIFERKRSGRSDRSNSEP